MMERLCKTVVVYCGYCDGDILRLHFLFNCRQSFHGLSITAWESYSKAIYIRVYFINIRFELFSFLK